MCLHLYFHMTAIFFDGKALHADRKIVVDDVYSRVIDGCKIQRDYKNRFALAVSGEMKALTEEDCDELAEHLKNLRDTGLMSIPSKVLSSRGIVITKHDAYGSECISTDFHAITRAYSPFGIGSGGRLLEGRYFILKNIKKAYAGLSSLDCLSGDVCDTATMRSLGALGKGKYSK